MIKAFKKGDGVARRPVNTRACPPGMVGQHQEIEVGPMAAARATSCSGSRPGTSRPTPERVQAVFQRAKSVDRVLTDDEVHAVLAALAETAPREPPRPLRAALAALVCRFVRRGGGCGASAPHHAPAPPAALACLHAAAFRAPAPATAVAAETRAFEDEGDYANAAAQLRELRRTRARRRSRTVPRARRSALVVTPTARGRA